MNEPEVFDHLELKHRLAAVENAIATQRLEGLEPDPRTIAELEQVAADKLDLADVIANLRRRIAAGEFKSPPKGHRDGAGEPPSGRR
ncbi:antitoxin VbhA family protein (plasmid) [Burkholderia multivorans]|uniref:antitoxin VbhA family protein n=1 Tax=Burkholderia multivorans TaxID=87883 RepID=UPI0020199175|nr:antitoxin VbhA family protein [Burkholderia multivorans]MCO1345947.1 antitoxin VbhA family protein [Burkholderia multivorans]MCO1445294.1 antitoxin VbhA family protein [Burkholderia multivorans]UQO32596.1 antitoxin VbhA family protein [Burkholderia multivorans]UQO45744.1 antitoxin VbhA family protein [Burkholderia multivorans]